MSIVLRYVLRNIKKSKFRSLIIILALMLSTVVLYSALMVRDSITDYYSEMSREIYKEYDIVVSSDENESVKRNEMSFHNVTVSEILPMSLTAGKYSDNNTVCLAYQADIEKLLEDGLITVTAELPDWDKSGERDVILSESVAKKNGFELGDTFKVRFANGEKELRLAALASNKGLYKNETTSNMICFSAEFSITDENAGFNQIYIKVSEEAKIADAVKEIEKEYDGVKAVRLYDEENVNTIIHNTNNLLWVILIAIIAANFFVIASLMKLMMAERVTVIGTFQCLGANNRWITRTLLLENSFYGLFGGILGVVVAQLLYRPIIQAFTGVTDIAFSVNNVYLVCSVAFAILLQLVFVIKTVMRASHRDVMANVFNKVSSVVKYKLSRFFVGVGLLLAAVALYCINGTYNFFIAAAELVLGIVGEALVITTLSAFLNCVFAHIFKQRYMHMGIRNINKVSSAVSNVKLIAMSLAIVYVVYIASTSLGTYFERALVSQAGTDYIVTGMSGAIDEYRAFDADVITDKTVSYSVSGTVKVNNTSYSGVTVTGMDDAILGVEDPDGIIETLKPGEMAVDGLFMKKFGYTVGDELDLSSDLFEDSADIRMKISGAVDTGNFNTNRNTFVFCRDDFLEYVTNIPNMVLISVEEGAEVEKIFNDKNLFLTATEDYIKSQEDSVDQVLDLLKVLIGLTLFFVFIGIVSNQLVGFIQRKKEFAVLLSIALSIKQMRKVMVNEVLFNALTGVVIGTANGLLLCTFLEQIMYAIGIPVPIIIEPQKIGLLFGVCILLILTTVILPIMNLKKLDIIAELKDE